jgi:hypothetical protein
VREALGGLALEPRPLRSDARASPLDAVLVHRNRRSGTRAA